MSTDLARGVLMQANIKHEAFWTAGSRIVFLSEANQLYSTKTIFDNAFPKKAKGYEGWEAHHILEYQDCVRLGLQGKLPAYDDQICVLIPPGGHRGRINSVLRRVLPVGSTIDMNEIKSSYALAYGMLGNYCGSSEADIAHELNQIIAVLIA